MIKKALAFWLALALCLPALTGLAAAEDDLFSNKDLTLADASAATAVALNDETVTIDAAGTYAVSGTIANGALRVVLPEEGTVYLLLNGVTVHNDTGAALYTENCKKVILTLAEGTVNAFSQGAAGSEDEDAAIYSKDDLTINGAGTLTVTGAYKDGINCRDSFKLVSGAVTVDAADDGVVGKDAVIVGGGTLSVTAVNDGIKATNEEDSAKGYVTLAGGEVTITTTGTAATAADAAAQGAGYGPETVDATSSATGGAGGGATGDVTGGSVAGGATGDAGDGAGGGTANGASGNAADGATGNAADGKAARTGKGGGRGTDGPGGPGSFGGGGFGGFGRGGMDGAGKQTVLASSAKGVKAVTTLTVSGGTLTIDAADDALHAMDVVLSGGQLTLASGDDGVHADNSLVISGGTVEITQSYEGLEAALITISGGETSVTASDDGINGAGGDLAEDAANSSGQGFFGGDWFSSSTGEVIISGGILRVNARGDGLDSNGSIAMSGGHVYVNGPTNAGNGALDYNGGFTMTGGTLVAVGASGMAQGVSAPSVAGVMANVNGSAGTLAVTDEAGNTVLSMEATIAYDSAVIYSDLLTDGGSYTIVTPGGEQAAVMSTQATPGGMGGGRW